MELESAHRNFINLCLTTPNKMYNQPLYRTLEFDKALVNLNAQFNLNALLDCTKMCDHYLQPGRDMKEGNGNRQKKKKSQIISVLQKD